MGFWTLLIWWWVFMDNHLLKQFFPHVHASFRLVLVRVICGVTASKHLSGHEAPHVSQFFPSLHDPNGQVAATPSSKLQGKSGSGGMESCWPLTTAATIPLDMMVSRRWQRFGDGGIWWWGSSRLSKVLLAKKHQTSPDLAKYSGFLKKGYPQFSSSFCWIFSWNFYHPAINGYPHDYGNLHMSINYHQW